MLLRPSQSTPKPLSDVDDDYDNDNEYEKRKSILDDIYAKPDEQSENENELDIYLSLDEEGKETDPFY